MIDNEKATIEKVVSFLEKVPIYPDSIIPSSIGIPNCNVPSDALLAEDDKGRVCFLSLEEKKRAIEYYKKLQK